MPGSIAHIVYVQKFCQANNITDLNFDYLIGNLIPDIRYFEVLPRQVTHINLDNKAWDNVTKLVLGEAGKNLILFQKGFLFHNFLDYWWADKYPISTTDWFQGTALKMWQDNYLFSKIQNIDQIKDVLTTIPGKYHLNGVIESEFARWISLLKDYLDGEPTTQKQLDLMRQYDFLPEDKYQPLSQALNQYGEDMENQFLQTLAQFEPVNPPQILL